MPRLRSISAVSETVLRRRSWDLFVCSSGYERRSRLVARRLGRAASRNLVVGFSEHLDEKERRTNDETFRELGFEAILESGHSDFALDVVVEYIATLRRRRGPVRILIDVSSMTRSWYGGLIRSLATSQLRTNGILVTFAYAAALPQRTTGYPQNEVVGPVFGFMGLGLPKRPTALVLGLGTDRGRGLGVVQEIDPPGLVTFQPEPAVHPRFRSELRAASVGVIEDVSRDFRYQYPLFDLRTTFSRLEGVCSGLSKSCNVIIASCGPKPFGLAAFLVASVRPEISVWRVTAGSREERRDRPPAGSVMLADTIWT